MDFKPDPETIVFQQEVQSLLSEKFTPDVRARVHASGTHHDWGLHRAIAEKGWLAAALPSELGGQGRGSEQLAALFREVERAGAPYDGMANAMLVSFILGHVGTSEQKAEVMSPILAGDVIPCLGYSESGSGSDVAAAVTMAHRAGADWVISGEKMFTSLAEEATWGLLLTRTNAEVPKHRGLTFFLVPMDDPGVSIRPLRTLSGKRTNVTFYDDVSVPDRFRVGEVDGGWQVMLIALAFERGIAGGVSDIGAIYDAAVTHLSTTATGHRLIEDPHVRNRLARIAIDVEIAELLGQRAAWAASHGVPGQEGAEAKLFGTEAYGRAAAAVLDILGPDGVLNESAPDAPGGGVFEHAYRYAPILTVAGGTSEIQKNLVAERTLGLPRSARTS